MSSHKVKCARTTVIALPITRFKISFENQKSKRFVMGTTCYLSCLESNNVFLVLVFKITFLFSFLTLMFSVNNSSVFVFIIFSPFSYYFFMDSLIP